MILKFINLNSKHKILSYPKITKIQATSKHFLNYSIFTTKYRPTNLKHPFHYLNNRKSFVTTAYRECDKIKKNG